MSALGAAAGFTLGSTVGMNVVDGSGIALPVWLLPKGHYAMPWEAVPATLYGLPTNLGRGPQILVPTALGAVGAYLGYTGRIPVLSRYV